MSCPSLVGQGEGTGTWWKMGRSSAPGQGDSCRSGWDRRLQQNKLQLFRIWYKKETCLLTFIWPWNESRNLFDRFYWMRTLIAQRPFMTKLLVCKKCLLPFLCRHHKVSQKGCSCIQMLSAKDMSEEPTRWHYSPPRNSAPPMFSLSQSPRSLIFFSVPSVPQAGESH